MPVERHCLGVAVVARSVGEWDEVRLCDDEHDAHCERNSEHRRRG